MAEKKVQIRELVIYSWPTYKDGILEASQGND